MPTRSEQFLGSLGQMRLRLGHVFASLKDLFFSGYIFPPVTSPLQSHTLFLSATPTGLKIAQVCPRSRPATNHRQASISRFANLFFVADRSSAHSGWETKLYFMGLCQIGTILCTSIFLVSSAALSLTDAGNQAHEHNEKRNRIESIACQV